jgi:hypothetical protein
MQRLLWCFWVGFFGVTGVVHAQSFNVESGGPSKWLKARVKKAKEGEKELVRLPLAYQSEGWGCDCPLNYIGTSPDEASDEHSWLKPIYEEGTKEPAYAFRGWVMVAEGYFTGNSEKYKGGGDPATVYEFKVTKLRNFQAEKTADVTAEVLLSGEEAKREVAKLSDNKPWLILTKSIPLQDKALEKKKTEALKKLTDAGYSSAEALDSRQTTALNCCYAIIVAGRYATEEEAKTTLKEVKKKFKGSYVKKGW